MQTNNAKDILENTSRLEVWATSSPGPYPRRFSKWRMVGRRGLLPTIRHFENRRGERPGDEVGGMCLTLHTMSPPSPHVSKRSAASALATSNFKLFQGTTPPDPPRLACPFGPPFNLHHMLCFIAQLWKLLLRTLIRHRDHKDQETAP